MMPVMAQRLAVEKLIQLLIDTDTGLIASFNELLQKLPPETAISDSFVSWLMDAVETTDDSVQVLLSAHEKLQMVAMESLFPPPG